MKLNEQYELELRNYQNIIKRNQNIYRWVFFSYFIHNAKHANVSHYKKTN